MPGLLLCMAVTGAAVATQAAETRWLGQPYLEALVVAILAGAAIRTAWTPSARWWPGIDLSAKLLLEIAVALLGASVSFRAVAAAGPMLLAGVAAVVVAALAASFGAGRLLGLSPKMAVLVACGNAICGNSAIAAVAPVIHADPRDVAASIAFTAILGVAVVLGLPLLAPLWSPYGYGVLAGMTVYAVPQVLAATTPVGLLSTQVGTLVKLVRVLMLGPVVLAASVMAARGGKSAGERPKLRLSRMVPWFILAFLALAGARSAGVVPDAVQRPASLVAGYLTLVSMAALGLGVDVRVLGRIGGRAIAAVTISLLLLTALSVGMIRAVGIG